ncbi:hypothetical protein Tco_0275322, partial [Tanacetum coccineum]
DMIILAIRSYSPYPDDPYMQIIQAYYAPLPQETSTVPLFPIDTTLDFFHPDELALPKKKNQLYSPNPPDFPESSRLPIDFKIG